MRRSRRRRRRRSRGPRRGTRRGTRQTNCCPGAGTTCTVNAWPRCLCLCTGRPIASPMHRRSGSKWKRSSHMPSHTLLVFRVPW
eukprot:1187464-Pyramimonas_sp.AAC.1